MAEKQHYLVKYRGSLYRIFSYVVLRALSSFLVVITVIMYQDRTRVSEGRGALSDPMNYTLCMYVII